MTIAKLALVLIGVLAASHAQAATVELYQNGWDTGGPLTITFTGEDTNSNSGIDTEELTAFSAIFKLPGGGGVLFSVADLESGDFSTDRRLTISSVSTARTMSSMRSPPQMVRLHSWLTRLGVS